VSSPHPSHLCRLLSSVFYFQHYEAANVSHLVILGLEDFPLANSENQLNLSPTISPVRKLRVKLLFSKLQANDRAGRSEAASTAVQLAALLCWAPKALS
jgi:hypothetical protein